MPAERRDYILRLIEQAAATLRRLRERLAGGATAGEIAREAREAQGELVGREAPLLRALDAGSALALLGDARRASVFAELLQVEAAALRESGEKVEADALDTRASALLDRIPTDRK